MAKTRLFIVDDSIFFRKFLTNRLSEFPNIEVVGFAMNALEAKFSIPRVKPDVVTLDVEMPGMSGIDLLKHFMTTSPIPVVIVSAVNLSVFDALSAGAVDFVKKPDMNDPEVGQKFINELANKVEIARDAQLRKRAFPAAGSAPQAHAAVTPAPTPTPTPQTHTAALSGGGLSSKQSIIALGASTGGTEATLVVLKDLPKTTPGMVIVQHMPPGFTKMYSERLNTQCAMEVREAKDGDRVQQGLALIAPGDHQMQVVRNGSGYNVKCYHGEKVSGHCPSVDVLFHSVAEAAGKGAVGIIMTGMGKDGADGLLHMRQKGAYTIGQDQESCVVYGMPMVAFNIGAVVKQAPCENISHVLKSYLNQL